MIFWKSSTNTPPHVLRAIENLEQIANVLAQDARTQLDPPPLHVPFTTIDLDPAALQTWILILQEITGIHHPFCLALIFTGGDTPPRAHRVDLDPQSPPRTREILESSPDQQDLSSWRTSASQNEGVQIDLAIRIDRRFAWCLEGNDIDALDPVARLLTLPGKMLRSPRVQIDPPPPARLQNLMTSWKVDASTSARLVREVAASIGHTQILLTGPHPPVLLSLSRIGPTFQFSIDSWPDAERKPQSHEPLSEIASRIRRHVDCDLVLAVNTSWLHELMGTTEFAEALVSRFRLTQGWSLSTRGELSDLLLLTKRLAPDSPVLRWLNSSGITRETASNALTRRLSRAAVLLRQTPHLFRLGTPEGPPIQILFDSRGVRTPRRPPSGPDVEIVDLNLSTIRWILENLAVGGVSWAVETAREVLPDNLLVPVYGTEFLGVLHVRGLGGQRSLLTISGSACNHLTGGWNGDLVAHLIPWTGSETASMRPITTIGRHIDLPLHVEPQSDQIVLDLSGLLPVTPAQLRWHIGSLRQESVRGAKRLVQPDSALDTLASGHRYTLRSLELEQKPAEVHLAGRRYRVEYGSGILLEWHGLDYRMWLGTRRARFVGFPFAPNHPPLLLGSGWSATSGNSPGWLEETIGELENLGSISLPFREGGVWSDPIGPLRIEIQETSAVPYDGAGNHLLRMRTLHHGPQGPGFGLLEIPLSLRHGTLGEVWHDRPFWLEPNRHRYGTSLCFQGEEVYRIAPASESGAEFTPTGLGDRLRAALTNVWTRGLQWRPGPLPPQ